MTARTRTGLMAFSVAAGLFVFAGVAIVLARPLGSGVDAAGNQVTWQAPATEAEARKLADYMLAHRAFEAGDGKRVELRKAGRTYEVRIRVKIGLDRDETYVEMCRGAVRELSNNVFEGSPVDIHLCDESMKTLRVVIAPAFGR